MQSLHKPRTLASDLSDRTMTLNLVLQAPDTVIVRSSEILGKGYRHRLSFHTDRQLKEVLAGSLAEAILDSLRSVPSGAYVLSRPEFFVELPGLILSGIHIMVTEAKDGVRSAILRFKEAVGAVNRAFLKNVGFDEGFATHSEKLAMNVLADICMPLLNLCEALDEHSRQAGNPVPAIVKDRARELQFQTELLKRFIFNGVDGHADGTDSHLFRDTHGGLTTLDFYPLIDE